jgi:hypothetical protein
MVTLIKRGDVWKADAAGHVIHEKYLREFKRKGGWLAVMSMEQFEGYFAEKELTDSNVGYLIDGLDAISSRGVPKDEVHVYGEGDRLMGIISNLYVPSEPDAESKESSS